jgi:hypothetical protein
MALFFIVLLLILKIRLCDIFRMYSENFKQILDGNLVITCFINAFMESGLGKALCVSVLQCQNF